MQKTFKKGLSFFLAVVLCASILPMANAANEGYAFDEFIIEDGVLKGYSCYIVRDRYLIDHSEIVYKYMGKVWNIVVPDNVHTLGSGAFSWIELALLDPDDLDGGIQGVGFSNMGLEINIIVPSTVKTIEEGAFANYYITSVSIAYGPESIPDYAFNACYNLKSVTLPDSITSIGREAFYDCKSLTSITIPDSVTTIEDKAFGFCKNLKSITLPKNLKKISYGMFLRCSNLESVTIQDGVTEIEDSAFMHCPKLKSITIPASVTKMPSGGNSLFATSSDEPRTEAFTIYGVAGSAAEKYAKDWNEKTHPSYGTNAEWCGYRINFVAIDDTTNPPTPPQAEKPSNWAVKEVNAAIDAGLVPTDLQKNYSKPVSRGQVAQMFINLIEKATGSTIDDFLAAKGVAINNNAFTDTNDKAVLAANALGILNGVGQNRFDPNGMLERAQIAAIINRVARAIGIDTGGYTHTFTDVSGHWVNSELGWPVHAKIINGVSPDKFDPKSQLTTEQAIAITNRALVAFKAK